MSYALSPNQRLLPNEVPGEIRAVVMGVAQDLNIIAMRTSGWRPGGKPSIHRFNCARDYVFLDPNTMELVDLDTWKRAVKLVKQRATDKFFDVQDERENPSTHSTGPHVHIEYDPV